MYGRRGEVVPPLILTTETRAKNSARARRQNIGILEEERRADMAGGEVDQNIVFTFRGIDESGARIITDKMRVISGYFNEIY